jgi:two-component system, OmpR family, phosphate regulon sensor histidine kinase PhoR
MQKIRLDVINNMTHEFKTPLTSLQLVSSMIMTQGSDMGEDKLKNYARIMHQECDKMLQQARQVLNAAYFEKGKFYLRKRHHNIHGLIKHVINSYQSVFGEGDIRITTNFQAQKVVVIVDRHHFANILTNLLDNAKKYTDDPIAYVQINTYNEGSQVVLEIEDQGMGIEQKHLKNLFDRFYRVPKGNIFDKSGYGVGLYYVKSIMKQMNAKIRVKSKPGVGSTFILYFKTKKYSHKSISHGKK